MKLLYLLLILPSTIYSFDIKETAFNYNKLERVTQRLKGIKDPDETRFSLLSGIFDRTSISDVELEGISKTVTESMEKNLALFHMSYGNNITLDTMRVESSIIDKLQQQRMIKNTQVIKKLVTDLQQSSNMYQRNIVYSTNLLCYNYFKYYQWKLNNIRIRTALVSKGNESQDIRELYHIYMRMDVMTQYIRQTLEKVQSMGITGFMGTLTLTLDGVDCSIQGVVDCFKKRRKKEVCEPKNNRCLNAVLEWSFATVLLAAPVVALYRICAVVGGALCLVSLYILPTLVNKYLINDYIYVLVQEVKKDCLKWLFDE